jgi:hypothetical protein
MKLKEQTAVEWLEEQYNLGNGFERLLTTEQFEQAKEIEKKQIIDTALVMYHSGMNKHQLTPEEYYNKIYLKENK